MIPDWCDDTETERESEIVTGDVAFASSSEIDAAMLRDADGQSIAVNVEPTGDEHAVVLRTEVALTRGDYTLIADCPSGSVAHVLHVAEAAPLPERLGQVTLEPHAEACADSEELLFAIELDPAAAPYAALLELSVSFDAGSKWVWIPFGALQVPKEGVGALVFPIPRCRDDFPRNGCAPRAETSMHVTAAIAGEVDALPVVEVPFDGRCTVPKDQPQACALVPRGAQRPAHERAEQLLVGLLFAIACLRRRRKSASR